MDPEKRRWLDEIAHAWGELLLANLPTMGLLFLVGTAGSVAYAALTPRASARAARGSAIGATLLAVLGGGCFALAHASLFDDAYISFRYARNLLEGHGLVFNPGERVEGYTNFLWTVLTALVAAMTPLDLPETGLWLSWLAFLANLVVIARLGQVLGAPHAKVVVPLAALLLCAQDTFSGTFGTSGLETGFASLLVDAGALLLITRSDARGVLLSGLCFILATLTRPDHALFYAAGSLVVALRAGPGAIRARRGGARAAWYAGGRELAAWAAPLLLYVVHALWRYAYYGDWLPNTYYAKSVDLSYWSQGIVYAAAFYLASHYWLIALLFAAWLALPAPDEATRRFRLFSIVAAALYQVYVVKVGGDFMHGRFFVPVMPLLALGACALPFALRARGAKAMAAIVVGLLLSTTAAIQLFRHKEIRWHLGEERTFWAVTRFFPVEIDHSNYRIGKALGALADAGVELSVATTGIGLLGYYSRQPILDRVGLCDRTIARLPVKERGRPGHEKYAPPWYIKKRMPNLVRGGDYIPRQYAGLTRIRFGRGTGLRRWHIYKYERDEMRRVRELAPRVRFVDFERFLDGYIAALDGRSAEDVARDLAFFRRYYFDHNDDPERLAALERRALGE